VESTWGVLKRISPEYLDELDSRTVRCELTMAREEGQDEDK